MSIPHHCCDIPALRTSTREVSPAPQARRPLPIVWRCYPHWPPRGPKPLRCSHCGQEFISVLDGPFDMDRSALLDWILALTDLLRDLQAAVEEGTL
jgi:hypothetical protein